MRKSTILPCFLNRRAVNTKQKTQTSGITQWLTQYFRVIFKRTRRLAVNAVNTNRKHKFSGKNTNINTVFSCHIQTKTLIGCRCTSSQSALKVTVCRYLEKYSLVVIVFGGGRARIVAVLKMAESRKEVGGTLYWSSPHAFGASSSWSEDSLVGDCKTVVMCAMVTIAILWSLCYPRKFIRLAVRLAVRYAFDVRRLVLASQLSVPDCWWTVSDGRRLRRALLCQIKWLVILRFCGIRARLFFGKGTVLQRNLIYVIRGSVLRYSALNLGIRMLVSMTDMAISLHKFTFVLHLYNKYAFNECE